MNLAVVGILVAPLLALLSMATLTLAQLPPAWTDENTLNRCGVTYSNPSNWIVSDEIRRNRFDTSDTSIFSARAPEGVPEFSLISCVEWEYNDKTNSYNNTEEISNLFLLDMMNKHRKSVADVTGLEIIDGTHLVPNIASNHTKDHADHATEHITANDTKEIKERNSRVADEFDKSMTDFVNAIDSGSASGSDVNTKVGNINDILSEIVSARIDKEQLDNVTVKALVVNDLVGESLEHYGGALGMAEEGHDENQSNSSTSEHTESQKIGRASCRERV